jgi:hypothetical protein
MHQTTSNRDSGTHDTVAAAFLLLAGIIVLIASGDAFAILVATVVIVTLAWGLIREIEHRVRNGAQLAPVTHLLPASTGRLHLKKTSAHALWRGPGAAA